MADIEKVIKALEQCREGKPSCDGCPYDIKSAKCLFLLHADALELLKESSVLLVQYEKLLREANMTIVKAYTDEEIAKDILEGYIEEG